MIPQNSPLMPVESTGISISFCLSSVAKMLQLPPKRFIQLLSEYRYIFKRSPNSAWEAYQTQVNKGLFVHKRIDIQHNSGQVIPLLQVRITPKGIEQLAWLSFV